ncbi:hypothetical protein [Agrilactobacillus composti]|uniref:hypothetical protein n=1 Tax=Agrilactobacillus composti TaxID=398555 RepID=UPI00068F97C5|nr:hypothetical protein [Agrilactobacillus composti]
MKIHSISDIPDWLFFPIKQWVEQNQTHFNIFIGVATLMVLFTLGSSWILVKKIGKQDERTTPIYLQSMKMGLITLLICEAIFPVHYLILQFRLYKYGFALLVVVLYLLRAYHVENHALNKKMN